MQHVEIPVKNILFQMNFVFRKIIVWSKTGTLTSSIAYYFPVASVAQLDARPTGNQEVARSIPAGFGNILAKRFSTIIPSLSLIQQGQLSVTG